MASLSPQLRHLPSPGIMEASSNAQPDYDSGEDVIEVAFPPNASSSSHPHGNTTTTGPQSHHLEQQQQRSSSRPDGIFTPSPRARQDSLPQQFQRLVEEAERYRTAQLSQPRIIRDLLSPRRVQPHHHHHRHHHHHHHRRHPRAAQRNVEAAEGSPVLRLPVPQSGPDVIDLTADEPDSPVRPRVERFPEPQVQPRRHPRRTNSQRISPPTLERSDGNLSIPQAGSMSNVIDLTSDSPEAEQPDLYHHRASARREDFATRIRNLQEHRRQAMQDQIVRVDLLHGPATRTLPNARGFTQRLAGIFGLESLNNIIIGAAGGGPRPNGGIGLFHQQAPRTSPKPSLEPTPPTREGFTRDTCAEPEEDQVVVCPCCNEELAYDPTETTSVQTSGNSKKRKRAPGEHHFWALKTCGHVYCAECFENRKPTKNNEGCGFPTSPNSKNPANDIRCAVAGCETKVALKGEWIGIFL